MVKILAFLPITFALNHYNEIDYNKLLKTTQIKIQYKVSSDKDSLIILTDPYSIKLLSNLKKCNQLKSFSRCYPSGTIQYINDHNETIDNWFFSLDCGMLEFNKENKSILFAMGQDIFDCLNSHFPSNPPGKLMLGVISSQLEDRKDFVKILMQEEWENISLYKNNEFIRSIENKSFYKILEFVDSVSYEISNKSTEQNVEIKLKRKTHSLYNRSYPFDNNFVIKFINGNYLEGYCTWFHIYKNYNCKFYFKNGFDTYLESIIIK
jgi:hypothetical protein